MHQSFKTKARELTQTIRDGDHTVEAENELAGLIREVCGFH
jgi:hypothetical protein